MLKKLLISSFCLIILSILTISCTLPETTDTNEATNQSEETIIPSEYTTLDEYLIMQYIIKHYPNPDLSYVLEHRAITESLPIEISTFSSWLYSYFEENDPQNLDLAKSLMARFIEINSKNSQLILDASDDPKYIVDYDGSIYELNPELHFLWVTNPVFDLQTGYVIASLEYHISNEEYFLSGYIFLYKYSYGSLVTINYFCKQGQWEPTTSNITSITK